MIRDIHINPKKIKDYLDTGLYKKVYIKFEHGLGDAIMFYCNLLPILKRHYPNIEFFVKNQLGQDKLFPTCDPNESKYDISFELGFPCAEWDNNNYTKSEKSAETELGFSRYEVFENYKFKNKVENPFIGVHFFSTAIKNFCMPEDKANEFWNKLKERNFIPIDTHLKHQNANKDHYNFEQRISTDINANIQTLINLIGSCAGFAGVNSGNIWIALGLFPPEKILFLYNSRSLKDYRKLTKLPIHHYDFSKNFNENEFEFNNWMNDIRK